MSTASVGELRSQGGKLLDRVLAGECITVTRNGTPVAELRALPRRRLRAAELVERVKRLPPVDPSRLRADVDAVAAQLSWVDG